MPLMVPSVTPTMTATVMVYTARFTVMGRVLSYQVLHGLVSEKERGAQIAH